MTIRFRLFGNYAIFSHYFSIQGRQGRPSVSDEVKIELGGRMTVKPHYGR